MAAGAAGAYMLRPDSTLGSDDKAIVAAFAATTPHENSVFKVEIPDSKPLNRSTLDHFLAEKIGIFKETHPGFNIDSYFVSETWGGTGNPKSVIIIASPRLAEAKK